MKRGILSAVLIAALAMQAVMPHATSNAAADGAMTSMDCTTHPVIHDSSTNDCPCYPDGMDSNCECAMLCTGIVALSTTLLSPSVQPAVALPIEFAAAPIANQTYSPVNPPPIL